MHRWISLAARAALATVATTAATAVHADTSEDARHLLDGALAEIQAQGLAKAVQRFNAGGKWKKDSLYLVAVQMDGTMLAHSANGKLPGSNMLEARDANGRAFVKDAIHLVKTSDSGQVDMRWGNPVTRRITDATMFVRRVPDQNVYLGSLVFK